MALTARKKKGIGSMITGACFIAVGVVLYLTTKTPDIVVTGVQVVGLVATTLGFAFVYPDTE